MCCSWWVAQSGERKRERVTKMMEATRSWAAVILAIVLTACATKVGRDFDNTYVAQIKPGETTKTQVREKLGPPPLVNKVGDDEVWTYAYYEGGGIVYNVSLVMFGTTDPPGKQKRLNITFNGDSVKDVRYVEE